MATKIPDEVKAFIVAELACYSSPSEVAALVLQEFDLTIDRRIIQQHDPTKEAGSHLAQRWIDQFEAARREFNELRSAVPIANKIRRLKLLDQSVRQLLARKNVMGAAQLMEQAAREVGGIYERHRPGPGGGSGSRSLDTIRVPTTEKVAATRAKLKGFLKGGKVKA